MGKKLLEKEARKFDVSLKKISAEDYQQAAREYGCAQLDDLYADLGYGKFSARQVLAKLAPSVSTDAGKSRGISDTIKRALGFSRDTAIQVHGHDDLLVYRAKCCNPIRGEAIAGYITRGKGIAVHSESCPNVQNLMYDANRRINVEWAGPKYSLYPVKLTLQTADRQGLLAEVTSVISNVRSNIQNIEARTGDDKASIDVTLDIVDVDHLGQIVSSLRKIDGVFEVERVMQVS